MIPPAHARRRPISPLLIVGMVVAVVVGAVVWFVILGYGAEVYYSIPASNDLSLAAEKYRDLGLPWEAKDLEHGKPLPDDRNAAAIIVKCDSGFERNKGDDLIKRAGVLAKRHQFDEVEQMVKPLDEEVSMGQRAAAIGAVHFYHDWDMGIDTPFTYCSDFKDLVRLFSWRADAEAVHGRADACLQNLRMARKLAKMAGEDEDLLPMLVQSSCGSIETAAERYGMDCFAQDPAALKKFAELVSEPQFEPDLRRALRGEAYLHITTCRNLWAMGDVRTLEKQENGEVGVLELDPKTLQRTGFPPYLPERAYMDRSLHFWTEAFNILNRNRVYPPWMLRELTDVSDEYSVQHSQSDRLLAGILVHSRILPDAAHAMFRVKAERIVTNALVQALLLRAKTGSLPHALAQIPGTWIDPFALKPLRLRLTEKGLRIYAVGPTGIDCGGFSRSEVSKEAADAWEYDIVAEYPAPSSD